MISKQSLDMIAKVCHSANKTIADFNNEEMASWEDAEQWQRDSAVEGVKKVIENPSITPEELHQEWMEFKEKDGWSYGEVKDVEAKTHPCMVPYHELPDHQRLKDHMFNAIVSSLLP